MSNGLDRFLGDTPVRTVVKLLVVSLAVGFLMSVFGLEPMDLWVWFKRSVIELWRSGFAALGSFARFIVIGAFVVVPVFLVIRILSWRKS